MHKVLLLNIGVYNNSGANRTVVIQATVSVRALLERVLKYVALKKKKSNNLCLHRQREMHMYYVDSYTT